VEEKHDLDKERFSQAPAGKPAPKGSAKAPADKVSDKGGSGSRTPTSKGSAEPRTGSKAPKAAPGKKQPSVLVVKPKVEDATPDEVAEDNVLRREEGSETVGEEDKSSTHEVFSRSPSQDLSQLNV